MYGKTMSIPDEHITEYLWLLTEVPEEELEEMDRSMASGSANPMELKKRLAYDITEQFHGREAATSAQEHFERVFQRAEVPEDVPTVRFRSLGEGQGYLFYTDSGPVNVRLARRRADNTLLADRVPAAETLCKLKLASSTSEAKRLLAQGSVEADGERVRMSIKLSDGLVIRVGRRRFVRLVEK
jgi:tyrosyl-tRNA synthetase